MDDVILSLWEIFQGLPLYWKLDIQKIIENNWENFEIKKLREATEKRHSWIMTFSTFWSGVRNFESEKREIELEIFNWVIDYLKVPDTTQDAYCPFCEENSVFDLDKNYVLWNKYDIRNEKFNGNQFCTSFVCTRCKKQRLLFLFEIEGVILKKIAQHPSKMDLLSLEVKKYQKELGVYSKEFYNAIWLHAQWIWVGAFVYLRRIFEKLIFDSYKNNWTSFVDEDWFRKLEMYEKISLLSEFLPEEIIENKSLYWILSIWIHQLSEEDCLKYFDKLKDCIEAILEEVIYKKLKAQRRLRNTNWIQEIHRDIQSK